MDETRFRTFVEDILIADPITRRGRAALSRLKKVSSVELSEDTFYEKIYIKPFTLLTETEKRKDPFEKATDSTFDPDCDGGISYEIRKKHAALYEEKNDFESRLKTLHEPLFVIKGASGSGKTTYVHFLKREFSDLHFYMCDFESALETIDLLYDGYTLPKFTSAWKFVSMVLQKINDIFRLHKNSEDEHIAYIAEVSAIYQSHFNIPNLRDHVDIQALFTLLKNYGNGSIDYKDFTRGVRSEISEKLKSKADNNKEAVYYIFRIFLRLVFCLSQLNIPEYQKSICVMENIEYSVPQKEIHPIPDCELQTILDGVHDAVMEMNLIEDRWQEYCVFENYSTFFTVLLVMRDTSVSIAGYAQYNDFPNTEIDITSWYCVEDICASKLNYFKGFEEILSHDFRYEAYRNILSDMSGYNWGLHDLLCSMYNQNYRRIVIDLTSVVSRIMEPELRCFNKCWKECEAPGKSPLKHLCRKFIFRQILDYIQQMKYFDSLLVEKTPASVRGTPGAAENPKSSYARKIATILHRSSILPNTDFISFPELILSVLQKPYVRTPPTHEQIDNLAAILHLMNETKNDETHWSPHVYIKFGSSYNFDKNELAGEMITQWEAFCENGEQLDPEKARLYGVKITSAGSFFARMVPDFEYFACRYAEGTSPLMAPINLTRKPIERDSSLHSGNESDMEQPFRCVEIIKTVRENAFRCIDEVIERDREFFRDPDTGACFNYLYQQDTPYKWLYISAGYGGRPVPHPIRILNHHMGYIQHYLEYVQSLPTGIGEIFSDSDKREIIKGIRIQLSEYKKKEKDIHLHNHDYFSSC